MVQACDLANGVELEFPQRGIRIRPYEISTRAKRHKFAYARVKVSIEAASLIEDRSAYREPVNLSIGGVKQNRYYVPEDGITFGEEQAWVELLDPLTILEDETISESYNSITCEEIVEELFSRRNDPNGLLTGIEIVDDSVSEKALRTRRDRIEDTVGSSTLGQAVSFVVDHGMRAIELSANIHKHEAGFDFDDYTLYAALKEVEEVFGVVVWSDKDGVLEVGLPESRSINALAVYGDPQLDTLSISGYHVGTSRNSLVSLHGRSSAVRYRIPLPLTAARFGDEETRDVHFVAQVETVDKSLEGNHGVLDDPLRVRSQEEMESAIQRKFIDSYMSHNSGTIEFNGMSSEDKTTLAELTVGDFIAVTPEQSRVCDRTVEGGRFIVNRVLHKVNARVGWQITAEVSRIAPEVEVSSVIYDYETDQFFETEEDLEDGENPVDPSE